MRMQATLAHPDRAHWKWDWYGARADRQRPAATMPPPINEVDVDYEAQIQEIRRLISSTSDPDRRLVLEEQLRELELASIQAEQLPDGGFLSARQERRKSFRPTSAKPRMTLSPLTEDKEVHLTSTSLHSMGELQRKPTLSSLVLDVMATSYDDQFPPMNVLSSDLQSFWMTSGMFPQVLRLTLREPVAIREVEVTFRYVHKLQIRTAPSRTNSRQLRVLETQVSASDSGSVSTHRFRLLETPPVKRDGDDDADVEEDEDERHASEERVEMIEVGIESAFNDFALVYAVRLHCDENDGGGTNVLK